MPAMVQRGVVRVLATCLATVVGATGAIGQAQSAIASTPRSAELPEVPARLGSAKWSENAAGLGGGPAAHWRVSVTPGGTAIWGAEMTAGLHRVPAARLAFTGLPAGMSLTTSGLPGTVASSDVNKVTSCAPSPERTICQLGTPLASGKFAVSAVAVTADRTVREGDYPISVALLDGDNATAGSTQFTVHIQRAVKDALFVHSGGQQLSALGARQDRRINVFNLGGSESRGAIQLSLGNVLPARIARNVSARGAGWNCPPGLAATRCTYRTPAFAPGDSAPSLELSYRVPPAATTGLKPLDSGHRFRWQMAVTGAARVQPTTHVETEHLLSKPTTTPTRPAKVVTGPGNMIVKVNHLGRSRLGGIGLYRIAVNNGGRQPVVGAQLRIQPPAHASILRFGSAVGWRCSTAGVCTRTGVIASHRAPPPIEVVLASNATSNRQASQRLAVVASWAGVRGTRSSNRVTATDSWDPLLQVSTAGSSARVHDRAAAGSKGMLVSSVAGLAKQKYSFNWIQVCPPRACARVAWDQTPHGTTPHPGNSVAFTPPAVRRPTELNFQLVVKAAGAEVRRQVKVTVFPFTPKVDARLGTTKWREPKFPGRADRSVRQGTVVQPGASLVINGAGRTFARPGTGSRSEWQCPALRVTPVICGSPGAGMARQVRCWLEPRRPTVAGNSPSSCPAV